MSPQSDESRSSAGARPVIALVEDEVDLCEMVAAYLEQSGFQPRCAGDAASARTLLATRTVDLVVLDLGLPDGNGLDLLSAVRQDGDLPVIIVTGRGDEADRVVGLELGADDYVVKPFSARELTARIKAVLRRTKSDLGTSVLRVGDLVVDTGAREARAADRVLTLTPLEYALLEFFATTPRRTYSAEQLLDQVWGSSAEWQEATTVSEHVYRLRRKLAAHGVTTPTITTVRGFGYRLDP